LERATKGLVIDASVAAKWFIPEEDSDKASRIVKSYADGKIDLYAPDLLVYELANVLRYRPDITEEALSDNIEELFKLQLSLIPPSSDIVSVAAEKARDLDLSTYDACYVVIAQAIAANLVTADTELYKKCKETDLIFLLSSLGEDWDIP